MIRPTRNIKADNSPVAGFAFFRRLCRPELLHLSLFLIFLFLSLTTSHSPLATSLYAAEFEVVDRFSVNNYSEFRGSVTIQGKDTNPAILDARTQSGAAALFISTNSSVGIGTAAPETFLDVFDPVSRQYTGTDATMFVKMITVANLHGPAIGFRSGAPLPNQLIVRLRSEPSGANVGSFVIETNNGNAGGPSERIRITNTGSVVIGLAEPGALFQVGGGTLTALNSGNVGIGTTNPRALFSIVSGADNTNFQQNGKVQITAPSNRPDLTGAGTIVVESNDAMGIDKGASIAFGGRYDSANAKGDTWGAVFGGKESATDAERKGYLALFTSPNGSITERMRITSGGNVGIGTTGPTQKLQVKQSGTNVAGIGGSAAAELNANTAYTLALENDTSSNYFIAGWNGATTQNFYVKASGEGYFAGNVGIGTTSPNTVGPAKLDVMGHVFVTRPEDSYSGVYLSRSGGPTAPWNSPGGTWAVYRYGSGEGDRFNIGIAGVSEPFTILTNGNVGIGTTGPTHLIHLAGGAYCDGTGDWIAGSDLAYKKGVDYNFGYGLAEIERLKPVYYVHKQDTDGRKQIGFIAQDMRKVIPEAVSGSEGALGISYGQLTAVLVKAMQEQQKEIESLKLKVLKLEKED